jgi:hypothetical protein
MQPDTKLAIPDFDRYDVTFVVCCAQLGHAGRSETRLLNCRLAMNT